MLFAGDSTMQQTFGTVASMITASGGRCAKQLSEGRSNHLYFTPKKPDAKGKNLFEYVLSLKPDLCLFTGGAWFHDMATLIEVWDHIKIHWTEMKTYSPKTKFIWKTQNPPHTNCYNRTTPIDHYTSTPENLDIYHYNLLPTFDEYNYNMSVELGFKVLDVSPLYLRPDAHPSSVPGVAPDCLHFCLPGPLDIVGNILLTMMFNGEI